MAAEGPEAFQDWLDGLVAAGSLRGEAGLERAVGLLARLGDPQNRALTIHVVGTAGKGSVVGLLTNRLVAAGVAVSTHQSPHVHDVRERFLLDGRLPEWTVVLEAVEPIVAAAEAVKRELGRPPSFFAVTAAVAWELGRRHDVDVHVIEAGIGGRLDATNVIRRDDVITVVTAIGLDHVDVLGPTVEKIAAEKAAVLEGRRDVVLGPQPDPGAAAVVTRMADGFGCAVHRVDGVFADWRQEAVATVEVTAALLEERLGRALPAVTMRLPAGRFEILDIGARVVILDGAHNPMKLDALGRSLATKRPACVVAAVGEAKDLDECAAALASLGPLLIATEFGPTGHAGAGPRSWPATALAAALHDNGAAVEAAPTAEGAAVAAHRATSAGDTILVTGSFLHLSHVRDRLVPLG